MPIKLDLWDYHRFKKSIPHASNYPVITNVSITALGLVTWTTDVASTSQVLYGTLPNNLGFSTAYDSTLVTSHSVQLTGLVEFERYFLKVQSFRIDALSISHLYTFQFESASYVAFILISPDTTRWAITVLPTGNLESTATPSGPTGAYEPSSVVLRDSDINYWTVTIDDTGHLITTIGGSPVGALASILLRDSGSGPWTLTVSTSGNLTTT